MKICLISNLYTPYARGGAEINTERLAKALNKDNAVFVITTKPFSGLYSLRPSFEIKENIKIYRFYPLNLFYVYFIPQRKIPLFIKIIWRLIDIFNLHTFFVVLYILKKERPDIVHTSNLGGFSFSAFWSVKLLRIPLIHTLYDYHLICPYAGFLICPLTKFKICLKIPLLCRIYSFFKKIIVDSIPKVVIGPSKFIIDIHKKHRFFKKSIFKVIPNFIDINRNLSLQKNDKETLDILYVGSLYKEKGVDILIKAFKDLKEGFLNLYIVGDGPERKSLEDLASSDLRIKFYGRKDQTQLKEFYNSCDVLVVSSIWYENFPTVVLEAFSFGLPVIGSKTGGIPELIEDGYNGFLFEPGNCAVLKNKIKIFIDDFKNAKILLNNMSNNVLEGIRNYNKEKILMELTRIYETIINKNEN